MKKVLSYLFFAMVPAALAIAQAPGTYKLAFQDSVRVMMETNQNTETSMVGGTFATAWHKLSLDQQEMIIRQTRILQKRRYRPFPLLADYFGAIGFAVEREHADTEKINSFLKVAGQVIEKEKAAGINSFFHYTRDFFEYHALHYERTFRLHAEAQNYSFDYIKDVSQEVPDTTRGKDNFNQWDNPKAAQDNNTVWKEDSAKVEESTPAWMQTTPQPSIYGPVLKMDGVTFNFSTAYDSAALKNTNGILSLRDGTFVGAQGTFGWGPTGLNSDSVYFQFKEYNFNVDRPRVSAEQGKLHYVGKIRNKVDGLFEFKSIRHKDKASSNYPRFMSFQSNVVVEGLTNDDMKYTGGFALNGHRIYSSSVSGDYAQLEVLHDGERKFTARSRQFEFKDSTITANRAMIQLYQDNDSIFHPAVQFRYDYGKRKLSLERERGQLRDAPYTSSFFNVDFSTDMIRWDLKSDSMNLFTSGGNNQAAMIIESVDYYHPDDYSLLGGKGFTFHPLGAVVSYAEKSGNREFYVDDLAQSIKRKFEEVRVAVTFLSQKGMVNYNPLTGLIQVKEKAIHFFDAKKGEADYDNLKIHSISEKSANATVNFPSRRMTIRGVDEVNVSDSLNVILKPDSSVITILQNRDLKFDGKITAGNFEINGKGFTFKYDSFFINLNKIDSIRFYVTEKNAKGQTVRRRVNNAMVGADSAAAAAVGMRGGKETSGTLFINLPASVRFDL